jgi:hypothetical protein
MKGIDVNCGYILNKDVRMMNCILKQDVEHPLILLLSSTTICKDEATMIGNRVSNLELEDYMKRFGT